MRSRNYFWQVSFVFIVFSWFLLSSVLSQTKTLTRKIPFFSETGWSQMESCAPMYVVRVPVCTPFLWAQATLLWPSGAITPADWKACHVFQWIGTPVEHTCTLFRAVDWKSYCMGGGGWFTSCYCRFCASAPLAPPPRCLGCRVSQMGTCTRGVGYIFHFKFCVFHFKLDCHLLACCVSS